MKSIILIITLILSTIVASNANTINLTGEYSNELGNPFRKLINEDNKKTISIYSKSNQVTLPVESNLDDSSFYTNLQHPTKMVLTNKSVENIVEDFYIEEYNVIHKQGDVEVNIVSGKINLTYINIEDNESLNLLNTVEVTLNLEIIKKGKKHLKVITLDNTLGRTGDNFNFTIRTTFDFEVQHLDKIVNEIIENNIYNNL